MIANKNFKLFFFLGLIIYGISFMATSPKKDYDPCQMGLDNLFDKDSTLRGSYIDGYRDTLIIRTDTTAPYTVNWNAVTDSVCTLLKRNCAENNKPILVINNRDTTRSNWDTRYGKKIYFKVCP